MSAPEKRPAFEPAERLLTPPRYDPAMKRPVTTAAGAMLVMLRVVVGVLQVLEVGGRFAAGEGPDILVDGLGGSDAATVGLTAAAVLVGVVLLAEALLAVLIYVGRNIPRVIVMVLAVLSISTAFAGWWAGGQEITLRTSLLSLAVDILTLLALSSRSAAAYARRNHRNPE